jgi:hypothetical protein
MFTNLAIERGPHIVETLQLVYSDADIQ